VFDEAHLLNDLFVEHNAIYFSEKRLTSFDMELRDVLDGDWGFAGFKRKLVAGQINDDTYKSALKELQDIYKTVSEECKTRANRFVRQPAKYLKLNRLSKKYHDLACKIDDLFLFNYPHVFEYKPKDIKKQHNEHEVTVKPIFVGEMFDALHNADHNLFMSATISESYMKRTMSLPGTTKHIRLPPQFPPENKKVVFLRPQTLNYSTMKDPDVIKKMCATVYEIVSHHTANGERGIILCPSFTVVQSIGGTLRGMGMKDLTIFEQQRGEHLADLLDAFKTHRDGPAVIITPSGFEGLDLPGDLSRYQVVVKAPFGSLGDRRIEHILNVYPDIYNLTTLMKIVQGAGRSVRSMDDHAVTYMLDTAIQRLWTKNNEWKDEFLTSFKTSLVH
jgi:Rad3-related DNA helicase